MQRLSLFLLLFLFCSSALVAQRLDGKWEGELLQEEGGLTHRYGFRMNLKIVQGIVSGNTEVWLPDSPDNFARMNLRGTLRGGMLSFEETEIAASELVPLWEWCLKQGDILLDTSGTEWQLSGPWHGTKVTPDCAPGNVVVRKPSEPRPVVVKADTVPAKPSEPQVVLNENKMPTAIADRRVTKQRTAVVPNHNFDIYVWDSDEIDGDIVSLNFNGEWILKDHRLGRKRMQLTLHLLPDAHNYLILYAKNEGRIAPNTAAISWIQNGKYVTTAMMSDMENCGAIQFTVK